MKGPLAALLTLALAISAVGQEAPTTKVLNCTEAGCHAKEMDHKFLHGPTAIQACDACHEYANPATHKFNLKRTGQELCNFCHIDKTATADTFVHEPFAKGNCTSCHDPHGATTRKLLKSESLPQLCTDCHTGVMLGKNAHHPAATDCSACHSPHAAPNDSLLLMDRRALCLSCHDAVAHTIQEARHPHEPASGDCLQCHDPHASDQVAALTVAPRDLCTSCHSEVGLAASSAKHPHAAMGDARACLNCHTPHGSEHKMQLPADPAGACLACHKQPIPVNETRTVRAVAEVGNEALHKHGPIAKGDCASCHFVHGAELPNLLTLPFSGQFYQAFSPEAYALCFKCHNKALVEPDSTETAFRDGSRNLHAVHVNKTAQGRSCRTCHATHASRFEAQIADTVDFGQWKLPINFKPEMTGGSCAPGCHKPATYNRGGDGFESLSPKATDPPDPGQAGVGGVGNNK